MSTGTGVAPSNITSVIGITKAYCTRVGEGPFPTELHDEMGESLRKAGQEFGSTTGRPRRCGAFDAVATRYAARINACDSLVVTKLDVLDGLDEVPICTGYRLGNQVIAEMPAKTWILDDVEPVIETMPGWSQPTAGVESWDELPQECRDYVARLAELTKCEIGLLSVGAERRAIITVPGSHVDDWLNGD